MPPSTSTAAPPETAVLLERGQTIDRFVILGLVGRGGMGEVYAAYDPDLDRKVAIKLLRTRGDAADGKTRLLREAQAIAKLQHPNVVVVYDVGTFADSVFIAMEFVEGRTVSGWLHAGKRTRREILEVFLAAGRGLASAHAAGLVHRDFKPDNVMVTNDGQVRVMDFGLARHVSEQEAATSSPPTPSADGDPGADVNPDQTMKIGVPHAVDVPAASGKYLSLKLTQTGAMLGTPAYMSPEQFAVQPTDARTNQFSFCVALFEALYGERPFDGDTFLTLMASVTTGAVRPPRPKSGVPTWMRRVLLRGLATNPDLRFTSMNALLTALQTDPRVRLRRTALALAAVALAGAGTAIVRHSDRNQQALCLGGADRLAGVWEPSGVRSARKRAIEGAFAATGASYAGRAFSSASRLLDEYADRWVSMYGDACQATHVRGEQSAELLDLRMGCLNERLGDLRALTDVFASADTKVVENAVMAAGSLARIDRCADVALLRAVIEPPADQTARAQVDAARAQLSHLKALEQGGDCGKAQPLAPLLLRQVRQLGYQPLLAETLITVAAETEECATAYSNIDLAEEAFGAAIASRHDEAAADAAAQIPGMIADRARQLPRARDWLAIGRAAVARLGGDPAKSADLDFAEAVILQYEGRGTEAVTLARRACAAQEKLRGKDHPLTVVCRNTEAESLESAGQHEAALALITSVRDDFGRLLGPTHPYVAMAWNNMGEILNSLHRYPESATAFEQAIQMWTVARVDALHLSYARTGIGLARLGQHRPLEAIAPLELALAARTDAKSPHALLGETRFALARALWAQPAERNRARALARLAREDYQEVESGSGLVTAIDDWLKAPAAKI